MNRRKFVQAGLAAGVTAAALGATKAAAAPPPGSNATDPKTKASILRNMLQGRHLFVIPEAHCRYAARLAEIAGFQAIYTGGNMISAMHLGFEDYGIVSNTELIEIGGRIAGNVDIPTITDGDQLGETNITAYRFIQEYERAGIAATHMEDTINPKHLGAGQSFLMKLPEMLLRINAAAEGRSGPDGIVIIARTDAWGTGSHTKDVVEIIRRGNAFAEAGADAFFPVSVPNDLFPRVCKEVKIPVIGLNNNVSAVSGSGMAAVIHAVQIFQPAMKLYNDMLGELKALGQFGPHERLPTALDYEVRHTAKYQELVTKWNAVVPNPGE